MIIQVCGQPILLHMRVCIFNTLHGDIISQTDLKITQVQYSLRASLHHASTKKRTSQDFLRGTMS